MKHWTLDYSLKQGSYQSEGKCIIQATNINQALKIGEQMIKDTIAVICAGSDIQYCIWNIGIIEDEVF